MTPQVSRCDRPRPREGRTDATARRAPYGKCLSLNFQFRRSACRSGPRGARTSPASILCHHPIAPRTIIGRAFDRMFDGSQEFFALAINFAALPAVCSDRIGEAIGLIIALIQYPIRMTGKTAFFQGFCLQSYLDGLKMEASIALHVSFDLTHTQLPHGMGRIN